MNHDNWSLNSEEESKQVTVLLSKLHTKASSHARQPPNESSTSQRASRLPDPRTSHSKTPGPKFGRGLDIFRNFSQRGCAQNIKSNPQQAILSAQFCGGLKTDVGLSPVVTTTKNARQF